MKKPQTSILNIKVDPKDKQEAQKLAKELGFSLSSVMKAYLKEFIRDKRVNVSLAEEPSEWLVKTLKESEKDIKAGRVSPKFDTVEEELAWLDDPNARYENGDPVR